MKLMQALMMVTVSGGMLWAQAPAKPASNTATKPVVTQPVRPKLPSSAKPAAAPPSGAKRATVVDKPAAAEKKTLPLAAKPAAKAAAPAAAAPTPALVKESDTRVSTTRGNRRDPFVSPIVRASAGGGPACETGKRCLMVDQIQLKGIVKSPNGYIAVVENAARRAYFLRENDPVFNGSVVRITGDTIVFREQIVDKLGKQSMREVIKKVNAPAV